MKIYCGILSIICTILVLFFLNFFLRNRELNVDLNGLKKQNDSLYSIISKNDKTIDSLNKNTLTLFQKNDSLKKSLILVNKRAKNYKKQHEKNINYINNLSNNDVIKLFTDKFTN